MLDCKIFDWQETTLETLMSARKESAFLAALSKAASELGFEYCAFGMRMPLPLTNPKMVMVNNYPTAWQQRYAEQNYLTSDPTVAHGARSVAPVVWSDQMFASCRPLWDEARDHGLNVGWAQSSFDARGVGGMLTLARSRDQLSASEWRMNSIRMSWLVQAAHEGMCRLIESTPQSGHDIVKLTAREIDVLRWTADGKTSGEVGQILNIAERTVNFHVNNSLLKLNVANKTAGVVKAAMLRLL